METNNISLLMGSGKVLKWTHNGMLYVLHTEFDDDASNPRKDDDGNLAVMACWSRRHDLGDELEDERPEDFWRRMVQENVPGEEIVAAAEAGKLTEVRVKPNEERPELLDIYEVDGQEYLACDASTREYAPTPIIDLLGFKSCMALLEPYAEWMPLWLYDHSGITMKCGDRTGQYADMWDSGQVGWIFITKKDVMEQIGTEYVLDGEGKRIREEYPHPGQPSTWGYKTRPLTDETWRARAVEDMKCEVERYDQYISNEVYWFELFQAVPGADDEDPEWEEIDSCAGFFGTDIVENGIVDTVGCGLRDAIEAGEYTMGTATRRVSYTTEFNF